MFPFAGSYYRATAEESTIMPIAVASQLSVAVGWADLRREKMTAEKYQPRVVTSAL